MRKSRECCHVIIPEPTPTGIFVPSRLDQSKEEEEINEEN
jgi:hypothetical protein